MTPHNQKTGLSPEIKQLAIELAKFTKEYGFNLPVLVPIIRHLKLVDGGTGYHEIKLIIRDHKLAVIVGADTEVVNLDLRLPDQSV